MDRAGINTIILSFTSATDVERRGMVSRRAVDALAGFGTRHITRITLNPDMIIFTACNRSHVAMVEGLAVILHGGAALTRSGALLPAGEVARRLARLGTAAVDEFEPPFLVFCGDASGAMAAGDGVGLVHLFSWHDGCCAALATSAALLGRTFELGFSLEGVFQKMTIGHGLAGATAFSGVTLAPAGVRARLAGGRIDFDIRQTAAAAPLLDGPESGTRAIGAAVGRCMSAVPDCGIELSGGMDSRMALAAIPRDLRKHRKAYTIGYPGSSDIEIAARIARRFAMDHVVVDLSAFDAESPDVTWNRARRVAYRDDFSTNLIDRLAIDCVDDSLLSRSRIGGVNGELARGFYYPMLPVGGPVTEASIDSLIRYRLTLNDAAPRELFKDPDRQHGDAALREAVGEALGGGALGEGREGLGFSLDRFYLHQRMRHWAGAGISRAVMDRTILAPFFHRDYIGWAMGMPVDRKRDSLGFSTVMASLDAELASIPLDSMSTPVAIARGGLSARLALLRAKAGKLGYKLAQRLGRVNRHTVGSQQFARKLSHPELIARIDWAGLSDTALFSPEGLDRLRGGALTRTRTSLGHIMPMHFLVEYLNAPAAAERSVTELGLDGASPPIERPRPGHSFPAGLG